MASPSPSPNTATVSTPRRAAEVVDPVELALELAAAGAGELLQARWTVSKPRPTLSSASANLSHCWREPARQLRISSDVRSSSGLLDRLADDGQHREQRERRAQHDPLAQRDVEQVGVVLVDEAVDGLVGDEEQDVVDGVAGVDVAAPGELLHPVAHVAQERASRARHARASASASR